ncbi:hypothetical protein [Caballeronia mineralivorans]|uniref:hypothetical protein n=1 Tax=Caballeronia mineralivorans TaxID=2010198 RepID=UPI00069DF2E9|nr:hypothetical protein [Caballeronia mineralivorans]
MNRHPSSAQADLGSAVGSDMARELRITSVERGEISSAFSWAYVIFLTQAARVTDRIGSKKAMFSAIAVCSILTPGAGRMLRYSSSARGPGVDKYSSALWTKPCISEKPIRGGPKMSAGQHLASST